MANCSLPSSPVPTSAGFPTISKKRHSHINEAFNEETQKYIEHLESELASAQAQLSSITSPTVTKARHLKLRALSVEARTLQDEIAQWEANFDERVREEVDRRAGNDAALKARVKELEAAAEEKTYRIKELEYQTDLDAQALESAEAANVELEKRVEIISEMLATSPRKLDFVAEAPPRERRRHVRPKSMLPRFPTTGSLAPAPTFNTPTHSLTEGSQIRLENGLVLSKSKSVYSFDFHTPDSRNSRRRSDAAAIFEHSPPTARSGRHGRPLSIVSDYVSDSWGTPVISDTECHGYSNTRNRPHRRMRRFQGGSVGPKPLILPSTTSFAHIPASAPPLNEHETPPHFPFPVVDHWQSPGSVHTPESGRRRASTFSGGSATLERFLHSPPPRTLSPDLPSSGNSLTRIRSHESAQETPRDFSSLGSAVGRNLFKELHRAKDTPTSSLKTPDFSPQLASEDANLRSLEDELADEPSLLDRTNTNSSDPCACAPTALSPLPAGTIYESPCPQRHTHDSTPSTAYSSSPSFMKWVCGFTTGIWRSRHHLARRCLTRAGLVELFSTSVGRLQWWIASALLGPMITRRVMARSFKGSPRSLRRLEAGNGSPGSGGSRSRSSSLTDDFLIHAPDGEVARRCPHRKLQVKRHSVWLWIKFSLTLAFAVGAAIKDGPGTLLAAPCCDRT